MTDIYGKITDSELEVMKVLWEADAPLPITQIRMALQERMGWEATTIKTLVQRLCSKGAVLQTRQKCFLYAPALTERAYNHWATDNLIRRLYRGSAKNLVAALVHSESLTREDVEELRGFFRVEGEGTSDA